MADMENFYDDLLIITLYKKYFDKIYTIFNLFGPV